MCQNKWQTENELKIIIFVLNYVTVLVYSYFEKGCRKKSARDSPERKCGYDQYTVPDDCSCQTYFYYFPLALANTFPWPFVPILSNFVEKRELEITHNAFHDCCVHFSQQPFLKQLYTVASAGYLPRHLTALVNIHH